MALLILAAAAGLEATAFYVDHGLRDDSASDADVVAAAASRCGVGFEARRVSVDPGPDLEARARQARYRALPEGVFTGHTMDDQAETVLLALLRGAGMDGLAGMRGESAVVASGAVAGTPAVAGSPVVAGGAPAAGAPARAAAVRRPAVRRPLLRLRRAETALLCERAGVTTIADPTNQDPRFWRNRVRHEVLPLLCDVAGRDVVPILARQADLLSDDTALLDSLASGLDPTDARALASAPLPLARRAVRLWLRSPDGQPDGELHPPSAAEVARVLAVASGQVRACELAGPRRIERHAGRLRVVAR
jgi:tRNA(Ile)-lysidine synthase